MTKDKVLPQLVKEITKPIIRLITCLGEEYETSYAFVLNIFLNFLVIYFLTKAILISTSTIVQIVISCVLVTHLFLWICWMMKDILNDMLDDICGKNGGKK